MSKPKGKAKEKEDKDKEEDFDKFQRKEVAELRPYKNGEKLDKKVSVSKADKDKGSPKKGDMIARNPKDHNDQWLVAKKYFKDNFEKVKENRTMKKHVMLFEEYNIMYSERFFESSIQLDPEGFELDPETVEDDNKMLLKFKKSGNL